MGDNNLVNHWALSQAWCLGDISHWCR